MRIEGKHDCDQTYDLMQHDEVHIRVTGRVFTGDLNRVCVDINIFKSSVVPSRHMTSK